MVTKSMSWTSDGVLIYLPLRKLWSFFGPGFHEICSTNILLKLVLGFGDLLPNNF